MAGYIKTLIVAKGAKFIALVNLPDVGQTPFASSLGAGNAGFVTLLATTFNFAVANGLAGVPEVLIVDAYTQGRVQTASPAAFGISNVTTPACMTGTGTGNPLGTNATSTSAAGGPSITCTSDSVLANSDRYNFADYVHLTPYANQLLADFVASRMVAANFPN